MNHTIAITSLDRSARAQIKAEFLAGSLASLTVTGPFSKLHVYRTNLLAWAGRRKWILETTMRRPVNLFQAMHGTESTLTVINGGPLYVKERKHAETTVRK